MSGFAVRATFTDCRAKVGNWRDHDIQPDHRHGPLSGIYEADLYGRHAAQNSRGQPRLSTMTKPIVTRLVAQMRVGKVGVVDQALAARSRNRNVSRTRAKAGEGWRRLG